MKYHPGTDTCHCYFIVSSLILSTYKRVLKGFPWPVNCLFFFPETWNQKFNSREFVIKGISVTRELANYFSMKREIKNLIHVNRDQQLFRDSWTWWLFFRETWNQHLIFVDCGHLLSWGQFLAFIWYPENTEFLRFLGASPPGPPPGCCPRPYGHCISCLRHYNHSIPHWFYVKTFQKFTWIVKDLIISRDSWFRPPLYHPLISKSTLPRGALHN